MNKPVKIDPTLMDEDKYQENRVEQAAETLMEAEEIKKDPKLMEEINKFLEQKKKKITSLSQLKDVANNFSSQETDE